MALFWIQPNRIAIARWSCWKRTTSPLFCWIAWLKDQKSAAGFMWITLTAHVWPLIFFSRAQGVHCSFSTD
ncbi:MAG: hypothetical protein C0410_11300, partial [Anaerolinea sp.]|nr:hypothetical protein [Anaerolinea sp.]